MLLLRLRARLHGRPRPANARRLQVNVSKPNRPARGFVPVREDGEAEEDEDAGVQAYQDVDLDEDDAPMDPDEEDPELEQLLAKVQEGKLSLDDLERDAEEGEEEVVDPQDARREEVLMLLLGAGGQLSQLLEQLEAEIDVPLLRKLDARITTAMEVGQPREEVEGLAELLRILRRQQQRASSSAALRLLDDLLAILGDSVAGDANYGPRRLEVSAKMQEAFTGVAQGLDIFEAAAALAEEGRSAAGQMLTTELVFLPDFMSELLELLKDAEAQQRQLAEAIRGRVAELQGLRSTNPAFLASEQGRAAVKEVEGAKVVFARRKRALLQVQDVALLARQFEVQNSPARQMMRQQQQ